MDKANNKNLWHYNPSLRKFANQNRKEMTKAEACIWKFVLSAKQMRGYTFRRQRPILNYIADFMCTELLLVIEIDGLTHDWEHVIEKDQVREAVLKEVGFFVIRFHDNEVLCDIENVRRAIEFYIENFEKDHPR